NTLLLCDNTLGPVWFRFQGDAWSKMPTSLILPLQMRDTRYGMVKGGSSRGTRGYGDTTGVLPLESKLLPLVRQY
ncbi:unnamed protein product, partial [Porites evermanni]